MAHRGEEFRLGPAGLLGAGAGAIVVPHLVDEAGVGLRQLSGALRDQLFQLFLVLAELSIGALALLFELLLDDCLIAEHADRIGHAGELVASAGGHGHVEPARRQIAHDLMKRRQPVDDVAMDVEPGDGNRDGDEEHDLEQHREPAELDGAVGRLRCIRSNHLGAGNDRGDTVVHLLGQRAIVVGQSGERHVKVQRPATLVEQAQGAGRPVGCQRGDQPPRLLAADRIVDQGHPARQDAQVAAVAALDPCDLGGIARAAELVEQQPLLGGAHPELEHSLQQEEIGLDQPVEGVQHGRPPLGLLGKLVEIGDDNRCTRCRVGGEGLRQDGKLAGRIQRPCDRGGEDGIHFDTCGDDLVLPLEICRERRHHAPELGDFLFGEAVSLQRIEASREQIGRGAKNLGLGLPLALGFCRGQKGAVRADLGRGLGDDAAFGDRRHGLVDDGRLRGVDVAQDDPADNPGCDGESCDAGERSEQAARDAEAAEHRQIRTPVGIERQSASE